MISLRSRSGLCCGSGRVSFQSLLEAFIAAQAEEEYANEH